MKIYLKFPDEGEMFIQSMLEKATEIVTNQDVRDRAFIYWRLLSIDPVQAKQLVFNERPFFQEETVAGNVNAMIELLNSVSSTYNTEPEFMFKHKTTQPSK